MGRKGAVRAAMVWKKAAKPKKTKKWNLANSTLRPSASALLWPTWNPNIYLLPNWVFIKSVHKLILNTHCIEIDGLALSFRWALKWPLVEILVWTENCPIKRVNVSNVDEKNLIKIKIGVQEFPLCNRCVLVLQVSIANRESPVDRVEVYLTCTLGVQGYKIILQLTGSQDV